MPKRPAVHSLPPKVKAWLDRALAENGFADYRLLEEELRKRGHVISKSSIQRYGKAFEERLSSLKLATEQAKAIVDAAPDEEGATNEAMMRLVQEKLFAALMAVDGNKVDLAKFARAIADLGRATVTQKRFVAEAREQARKELQEKMNAKIHALGSAKDLKALSDEELEQRIAALAGEV